MLKEEFADGSLEKVMQMAEDDVLKAKTPEEKEDAYERFIKLHKVFNERLKIQDDYMVAENKAVLESERFDNDKAHQEMMDEENRKNEKVGFWVNVISMSLKGGAIAYGLLNQRYNAYHNVIETDGMDKGVSRGITGLFSKWISIK